MHGDTLAYPGMKCSSKSQWGVAFLQALVPEHTLSMLPKQLALEAFHEPIPSEPSLSVSMFDSGSFRFDYASSCPFIYIYIYMCVCVCVFWNRSQAMVSVGAQDQ